MTQRDEPPQPTNAEEAFLRGMARRYGWDMDEADALPLRERLIWRVMDIGRLEDIQAMESRLGRQALAASLRRAPAGAMRPKSWAFWHYRLGLADAERDPPPMPARRVAPEASRV